MSIGDLERLPKRQPDAGQFLPVGREHKARVETGENPPRETKYEISPFGSSPIARQPSIHGDFHRGLSQENGPLNVRGRGWFSFRRFAMLP
jgi:hypothetical protein